MEQQMLEPMMNPMKWSDNSIPPTNWPNYPKKFPVRSRFRWEQTFHPHHGLVNQQQTFIRFCQDGVSRSKSRIMRTQS